MIRRESAARQQSRIELEARGRRERLAETWRKIARAPNERAKTEFLSRLHMSVAAEVWRTITPLTPAMTACATAGRVKLWPEVAENKALDRAGADVLFRATLERRHERIVEAQLIMLWDTLIKRFVSSWTDPWIQELWQMVQQQDEGRWKSREMDIIVGASPDIPRDVLRQLGVASQGHESLDSIWSSPRMTPQLFEEISGKWEEKNRKNFLDRLVGEEWFTDRPKWIEMLGTQRIADGLTRIYIVRSATGGSIETVADGWTRRLAHLTDPEFQETLEYFAKLVIDFPSHQESFLTMMAGQGARLELLNRSTVKTLLLASNKAVRELGIKITALQGEVLAQKAKVGESHE